MLSIVSVIMIIFIIIDNRDYWNPPQKAPATPKILNHKRNAPYNIYGRPTILNPKWANPHVDEEIEEFREFLRDVKGTTMVRQGKIPIRNCSGKLLSWSYKPFREGYWKDFVTSGLSEPKNLHWFGSESMIPNPRGKIVESPLTLVSGEEDILRFIGGSAKVRLFSSNQPTFPKFNVNLHGDLLTDQFHHKIRGEEFTATDGMILVIPRGWAYRIQVDNDCLGVLRIPVYNILSMMNNLVKRVKSNMGSKPRQPKGSIPVYEYGSDTASQESGSEGGSDCESDF